jgi:hypothetical protein
MRIMAMIVMIVMIVLPGKVFPGAFGVLDGGGLDGALRSGGIGGEDATLSWDSRREVRSADKTREVQKD